jgi:hypothetical protein
MTIRLRFVQGSGFSSGLIEYREGVCMPFTPSHVECVDPVNGHQIGQHMGGGMQSREPGYDVPFNAELFLDLPATDQQTADFYAGARAAIGEPYDWKSILGFALPGHFHEKYNAICSAKMTQLLRKVDWFPSKLPLCVPFHCIDPRDLLLILSAIIEVRH